MTKKLSAVTGQYQKDGQTKAEWTNIGVIGIDKNGKEYVLLDPNISLAGVLVKQNVLAQKQGKPLSDMVFTSVFEEQAQDNQQQQNGGYQQQAPQQQNNQQQGGYNQNQQGYQNNQG